VNDIRIVLPESAATLFRLLKTPCHVVEYLTRAIVSKYDRANGRDDLPIPPPSPEAALPWAIVEQDVDRQIEYAADSRKRMADGGRKGGQASLSLAKPPLAPLSHPKPPQAIRLGKERKGKERLDEVKTKGGGTSPRATARPTPSLGNFSDGTFYDPSLDPVDIAIELTNTDDPADRRAYGALLKSIGGDAFRDALNTYWHELNAGEVPRDFVAALKARLRNIEKTLKEAQQQ
jgi:general stress protein YciG